MFIKIPIPSITLFLLFSLLAGCQIAPLYGERSTGNPVHAELAAIQVDNIEGDVGQKVHNELLFDLYGGASHKPKEKYKLRVVVTSQEQSIAVQKFSDVPDAKTLSLVATFVLSDLESGKTIYTGSTFANASYDYSSQHLANVQATREAEKRASKQVSLDIRTRLASIFASKE